MMLLAPWMAEGKMGFAASFSGVIRLSILGALLLSTEGAAQDSCGPFFASLKQLQAGYEQTLKQDLAAQPGPITIQRAYDVADTYVAQNPTVIQDHLSAAQVWLKSSGEKTKPVKTDFLGTKAMEGVVISAEGTGKLSDYAKSVAARGAGTFLYTPHMALKTGFGATVDGQQKLVYADADSVALGRPSPSLFHEDVHLDTNVLFTEQKPSVFLGNLASRDAKPITSWAPNYPTEQRLDEMMAYTESVKRSAGEYRLELEKANPDNERAKYWLEKVRHYSWEGAAVTRQTYEVTASLLRPTATDQIELRLTEQLTAASVGKPAKKTLLVQFTLNSRVSLVLYLNDSPVIEAYEAARNANDSGASQRLQTKCLEAISLLNQTSFDLNLAFGKALNVSKTVSPSDAKILENFLLAAEKPYEIAIPQSGLTRK